MSFQGGNSTYRREWVCECGRKALFRLRIRQLDPELLLAHRVYLYLCTSCYHLELETCEEYDLRLPLVTPVVLHAWQNQFARLYAGQDLLAVPEKPDWRVSRRPEHKPVIFASIRRAGPRPPHWSVMIEQGRLPRRVKSLRDLFLGK